MGVLGLTGRKRLGRFFTPSSEAQILADWVVRSAGDRILEPSAGDGALLLAALAKAKVFEGSYKATALACDVDRRAIAALRDRTDSSVELRQIDFFKLDPEDTPAFDVVLANPPFTRNHQLSARRRAALRKRFPLKGAAGLWAYFVLHARKFLKPGGRMAVVVPGAATFADYSEDLLRQLKPDFRSLALLELSTKPVWIGEADERGVLLLADGYREGATSEIRRGVLRPNSTPSGAVSSCVPPASFEEVRRVSRPLASLADLSIGLVTGCNPVFLMNGAEVDDFEFRKTDLSAVVSRAKHVRGARVTKVDLSGLARGGEKTWLMSPVRLGPRNSSARRRLALIDSESRNKVVWLNKRDPWWKVDKGQPCDAVFTYMNDLGPRLALADAGIYCTNTLHRVVFRKGASTKDKYVAVLSLLSTFGQLYAEGLGRSYGGGVLKFELREARALPVLPASSLITDDLFSRVDVALRAGDLDGARMLADEALLPSILGRAWQRAQQEMELMLRSTRLSRRRGDGRVFSIR